LNRQKLFTEACSDCANCQLWERTTAG